MLLLDLRACFRLAAGLGHERWTRAVSTDGEIAMEACAYTRDLKHEEWNVLKPLLPKSHSAGRRQTYPLRRMIEAIFYLLRTGAQWRMLPHEYPPRCADSYHYAQWRRNGLWKQVTHVLWEAIAARSAVLLSRQQRSLTANRSEPLRWADHVGKTAAKRSKVASAICSSTPNAIC